MKQELRKQRVLVTGGAGFVGSHLAERLAKKENRVVILDNLSSGTLENVPRSDQVTFVHGDIRDIDLVDRLVSTSDVVFHLAEFIPDTKSYGSGHVVKYSIDNPLLDLDVSTRGTLIVLSIVNRHKKRLVFASTAAVYGNINTPMKENSRPKPVSPYGASKLCAEEYVNLYSRIHNTAATILRLFNVYGSRQKKYVMYDMLLKLRKNPKMLEMLGSGKERRDFVHVSDAVDAFIRVAGDDATIGKTFNVGTGVPTSISDLAHLVARLQGLRPTIRFTGSSWKGDVRSLIADISRISRIGFEPKHSLKQGIAELVRWFDKEKSQDSNQLVGCGFS